jgi:hypothetical protein
MITTLSEAFCTGKTIVKFVSSCRDFSSYFLPSFSEEVTTTEWHYVQMSKIDGVVYARYKVNLADDMLLPSGNGIPFLKTIIRPKSMYFVPNNRISLDTILDWSRKTITEYSSWNAFKTQLEESICCDTCSD